MTAAKVRLLVAAGAFVLWIGYLGYLALPTTTSREVLSRAQFLVSQLDVIAQVDGAAGPAPTVTIQQVLWPPEQKGRLEGKTIVVKNLPHAPGWTGPGPYILPLIQEGTEYRVAPVPPSPGSEPASNLPGRVYHDTPLNRTQLEHIRNRPENNAAH